MRLRGRCSSPKHVDYQGFFSFFETCSLQINVGILDLGTPGLKRKTTDWQESTPTHQADFHPLAHLASHCGPVWPPDMAREVEHPPKSSAIGKIVSPSNITKHHKIPTKIGIDCNSQIFITRAPHHGAMKSFGLSRFVPDRSCAVEGENQKLPKGGKSTEDGVRIRETQKERPFCVYIM